MTNQEEPKPKKHDPYQRSREIHWDWIKKEFARGISVENIPHRYKMAYGEDPPHVSTIQKRKIRDGWKRDEVDAFNKKLTEKVHHDIAEEAIESGVEFDAQMEQAANAASDLFTIHRRDIKRLRSTVTRLREIADDALRQIKQNGQSNFCSLPDAARIVGQTISSYEKVVRMERAAHGVAEIPTDKDDDEIDLGEIESEELRKIIKKTSRRG